MSNNNIIVQKFGGTSVANIEAIKIAASKVASAIQNGYRPIIVVSAMAGVTNQLVAHCSSISNLIKPEEIREYDVALSSGEIVTSALMALTLTNVGLKARSMLGWQLPIHTNNDHSNALIQNIKSEELLNLTNEGIIPVIAGFQGISKQGDITTLGRGGSDTTAAAIAASVGAKFCDIYTDVEGIFTTDPRLVKEACRIEAIGYEEMLEFSSLGAKVLHTRAVQIAMRFNIPVRVISTFSDNNNYTLVTNKDAIMENREITGITYNRNVGYVYVLGYIENLWEQNFAILEYHLSSDGEMMLLIGLDDLALVKNYLENKNISFRFESNVAVVSVVGFGIKNDKKLVGQIMNSLTEQDIKPYSMNISEIKISFAIGAQEAEKIVKLLHYLIMD